MRNFYIRVSLKMKVDFSDKDLILACGYITVEI